MGNARFTMPLGKARKTWTQEPGGGAGEWVQGYRGELERQPFVWSQPHPDGAWGSAILVGSPGDLMHTREMTLPSIVFHTT